MSEREFESHSSVTTYTLCPRKYKFRYIDGYEPAETAKQLRVGKEWGSALETGSVAGDTLSEHDRKVLELTYACYVRMWGDQDDGMQREVPFELPEFRGYFDGLHHEQGRLQESKFTKSWIRPEYWEVKEFDQQCMLYMYAARRAGHKVTHITYDVTRNTVMKPPLKMRRGRETTEEYLERLEEWIYNNRYDVFQRRDLTWTDSQLEENYENMRAIIGGIPIEPDWFPQHKVNCMAFGNPCEYLGVCTGEADLADPELYKIRKRS